MYLIKATLMCRHCEERSDVAISMLLIPLPEIAALRHALKDGVAILRKYSRGAMTGGFKQLPFESGLVNHRR